MTPVDERAQELWDDYSRYKDKMFEKTNSEHAPWVIIDANEKNKARLGAITHVLDHISFEE